MSKLSDKELNILGKAYQNAFDERVCKIGGDKIDAITIANTWQWYKIQALKNDVPMEARELLKILAEDIDRLDDMCREFKFQDEKEQLLTLILMNEKLNRKIDLLEFSKYIKKGNNIINCINYLLNRNLCLFNYVISEINDGSDDYITAQDWLESDYVDFLQSNDVRFKKGIYEL